MGPNFWHLIKERMVLYLLALNSARSVPGLLGQISGKFSISFCGGEGASGLNVLALSERALRALPDLFNFSSLGPKSARPEFREVFNLIFPGGRLRLGPNFWHLIKERMVLYILTLNSARSVPGLFGQISGKFSISFLRVGRVRLGSMFWHCQKEPLDLYLMLSISARSVPSPLGQNSEKFSI